MFFSGHPFLWKCGGKRGKLAPLWGWCPSFGCIAHVCLECVFLCTFSGIVGICMVCHLLELPSLSCYSLSLCCVAASNTYCSGVVTWVSHCGNSHCLWMLPCDLFSIVWSYPVCSVLLRVWCSMFYVSFSIVDVGWTIVTNSFYLDFSVWVCEQLGGPFDIYLLIICL